MDVHIGILRRLKETRMDHDDVDLGHTRKSHVRNIAIVLVIAVLVILHAIAAVSIFHRGFGAFSLKNPATYPMIGLFVVLAIFKLRFLLGFESRKEKHSAMANARRTYLPAAGRDWLLPFYDVMTKLMGADQARRALLDQAEVRPGHRALDLGCGTGSLAIE